MSKKIQKRKPTVLNPKGSGRHPKFNPKYGKVKRISVSVPDKKEQEIKDEIEVILQPYML